MIRHVLLALLVLLAGGAAFVKTQGTFAQLSDTEVAGVDIEAEVVQEGQHDPWHAYEDVNNDNAFTSTIDIAIQDADILDGTYTVSSPGHGLVVPKSVGPIEPASGDIVLEAGNNGHLVIEVRLSSPGDIQLVAGTDLMADDLVAQTQGAIAAEAGAGELHLAGAYLQAGAGTVHLGAKTAVRATGLQVEAGFDLTIEANNGPVQVASSTLEAQGQLTLQAGGEITAERGRLVAQGLIYIDAKGDIRVKQASLETPGEIEFKAGNPNDTLFVQDARFDDANDTAKAGPGNVEIVGTPAFGSVDKQG